MTSLEQINAKYVHAVSLMTEHFGRCGAGWTHDVQAALHTIPELMLAVQHAERTIKELTDSGGAVSYPAASPPARRPDFAGQGPAGVHTAGVSAEGKAEAPATGGVTADA